MIATAPGNRMETNQDVGTDPLLFKALHRELGFVVDLAASPAHHMCSWWLGRDSGEGNGTESKGGSLSVDWHKLPMGWHWLNCPFRDIDPWAEKCLWEMKKGWRGALLTPASTDTNWFDAHVYGRAEVRLLKGRPIFDFIIQKGPKAGQPNKDPYPKPCMVSLFEPGRFPTIAPWDWRASLKGK
jgi:hypothetical protein